MAKKKSQIDVDILGDPGPLHEDSEEDVYKNREHVRTFDGTQDLVGKPDHLYAQSDDDTAAEVSASESENEEEKVTAKPPEPGKEEQYATFIPRGAWGANPEICPDSIPLNSSPVLNLVVTWTDTEQCHKREECQKTIRQVQKDHIESLKLPDIRYHYIIGDDVALYEGRGWHKRGEMLTDKIGPHPELINKEYVEVALIDKKLSDPTKTQLEVLSTIVTLGVEENWLTTNFRFYWRCDDRVEFYKVYNPSVDLVERLPPGQPISPPDS